MKQILQPSDPALDELCCYLEEHAGELLSHQDFPAAQLDRCAQFGVFKWFSHERWGGFGWSDADIYRGYIRMSSACLTTTFVMTQRQGATRRIENSGNEDLAAQLIPRLMHGELFATVGISHLTTSRRHLAKPIMQAREVDGGFELNGMSPWVTGANSADWVVVGATLEDGRQILAALDTRCAGVSTAPGPELVALSASQTGSVQCDSVFVPDDFLLAGPIENVMSSGVGGNTGGLQTSALALGLSQAAIGFLQGEADKRSELLEIATPFVEQWSGVEDDLMDVAAGGNRASKDSIRTRANQLALRTTHAALTAAKGAGYLANHPVGRWCREALFFLVWSCPQNVMNANLCQFAGVEPSC